MKIFLYSLVLFSGLLMPWLVMAMFKFWFVTISNRLSYFLTGFLVVFFPIHIFWLMDALFVTSKEEGMRCGISNEMGVYLINLLLGLPISMAIQWVLNILFFRPMSAKIGFV